MLTRRSFLSACAASSLLQACSRCDRAAAEPSGASPAAPPIPDPPKRAEIEDAGALPRGDVTMDTWTFEGNGRAAVLVPAWARPSDRFPMLLALHGRGEANKGPDKGVLGWPKDYALVRAIQRVCAPPLTAKDLEGFVDEQRLATHNAELSSRPFGGLVVVCPYSPDVDLRKPRDIRAYGDYVMNTIVPRAKKELPVVAGGGASSIGIDGVSLGGALALRIGLAYADRLRTVGSLQAAIGEDQVADFTELAKAARAKNPRLELRLLTSTEDYFRNAIGMTSRAWKAAGIEHDFADVPGPHDYPFNRGPGAIEMLLWHDRLLART